MDCVFWHQVHSESGRYLGLFWRFFELDAFLQRRPGEWFLVRRYVGGLPVSAFYMRGEAGGVRFRRPAWAPGGEV
jgi:hypothetical protein